MSRTRSGGILGLAVVGMSISARGDEPPLVAPADAKPPAPAAPVLPVPKPRAADDNKPVLAVPGLTGPATRPARGTNAAAKPGTPQPSLSPDQTDALPPLFPPLERPAPRAESDIPQPLPSQRFRPRIVESVPRDAAPDEPRPTSRNVRPTPNEDLPPVRDLPGPKAYDEATSQRSRMLNRLIPNRPGARPEGESSITTEPRSDPAADAALKRRIEKQIAESVGKKVKEVEVRVVGRMVAVRVSGVRLLQRRGVKRTIESLPALNGYKAVVDVRD